MTAGYVAVFITASSEDEAARIARALVEERLAACVNIIPAVRSIYRWEGKVEESAETMLIAKTDAGNMAPLIERVRALHSYTTPEIIALPVADGYGGYLEWLGDSIR